MHSRLLLCCHPDRSTFTLSKEGEKSCQFFTELVAALDYAAKIVSDDTPITISNGNGKVIVESVISPRKNR